MKLRVFASGWALGSLGAALDELESGLYDGLEAAVPIERRAAREVRQKLDDGGSTWIADLATGSDYAPHSSVALDEHLDDLKRGLERAAEARVELVTCSAGSDSWPIERAIEFFGAALELADQFLVPVAFETRRGRPTFTPWATLAILRALPKLRLTCDFSQWCVVCERLPDDSSPLAHAMSHASHLRARVGYAQGPQVPDPRAPEFRTELARHESWWWAIWKIQRDQRCPIVTATPSFGLDGYTHELPFTRSPVTNPIEVNRWMVQRLRNAFTEIEATTPERTSNVAR